MFETLIIQQHKTVFNINDIFSKINVLKLGNFQRKKTCTEEKIFNTSFKLKLIRNLKNIVALKK